MKRKLVLLLALVMLCSAVLTACGSGKLEGTWKLDSIDAGDSEEAKAGAAMAMAFMSSMEMEFKKDGVMIMRLGTGDEKEESEGTYTQDGNKVIMTSEGQDQEAKLDGNKLIMEEEGLSLVFKKK